MVTLVTLAVTHHSSRLDPSVIPHDTDDNTAALASMTHPIVPPTDTLQQEKAKAAARAAAAEAASAAANASGKRARKEEQEHHAHVHAKHDETTHVEKKAKAAGAADVDVAHATGGSSGDTHTSLMKQKVLEEKMADEKYVKKLVKKAAAVATLAQSESGSPAAPSPPPPPDPVVKAQNNAAKGEPQPIVDLETAPEIKPGSLKDDGFPDASWAADDYRTALVSTKDPGALNRLDPVANSPGPNANKTSDPTMKKMLKKIDESKEQLAEKAVEDDGAFNETKFIDELVDEDIVLAKDEEPEAALRTSGGNYLDGGFDEDDMARILSDDATMDADDRNATNPTLDDNDIVANVKEEVPMAAPFDEEGATPVAEAAPVEEEAPADADATPVASADALADAIDSSVEGDEEEDATPAAPANATAPASA